jgi:23S rRNA (adenine2503-C2)-methyltransferase
MKPPSNLTGLSITQLTSAMTDLGHTAYRAHQLFSWIHRSLAQEYSQMSSLPHSLRSELSTRFRLGNSVVRSEVTSKDGGTRKVLLGLSDGETIESVLMSYGSRRTVCLSTQVGCPLDCAFCATGQSGFVRNLTPGEIVDQYLHFARSLAGREERITHVVLMGMGEPLMNYDSTWRAIRILMEPLGQALGSRRFTISTAGWVPGVRLAAREGQSVKLALSLHAPNDKLRDQLVPLNRRYPLAQILSACREYTHATGRRLTLEYAMIDKVNDGPSHAEELASLLRGIPIHVNLIPLSPVASFRYQPSSHARTEAFLNRLKRLKVPHTLRLSRGVDIEAGCGQLRRRSSRKRS